MSEDAAPPPPAPPADRIRDADKLMLVLCYMGPLALVPLVAIKDSDYVQWHARQGLALMIAWVAYSVVITLIGVVPLIGWLFAILGFFGHLGLLILMVIAIVKAQGPERWKIPYVADLAEKIKI
jgi:uncharacterized membrane protein